MLLSSNFLEEVESVLFSFFSESSFSSLFSFGSSIISDLDSVWFSELLLYFLGVLNKLSSKYFSRKFCIKSIFSYIIFLFVVSNLLYFFIFLTNVLEKFSLELMKSIFSIEFWSSLIFSLLSLILLNEIPKLFEMYDNFSKSLFSEEFFIKL